MPERRIFGSVLVRANNQIFNVLFYPRKEQKSSESKAGKAGIPVVGLIAGGKERQLDCRVGGTD